MRADCSTRTEKSCSQGFYPCLALRAKTQVTSTRNVTARVVASVQCRSHKCRNTRNAQNPAGLTSAVPCLLVSSSPRAKDDMIAYPLYSSVSQSCPAHGIADWCHLCCNAVAYTRNGPHEDSLPISSWSEAQNSDHPCVLGVAAPSRSRPKRSRVRPLPNLEHTRLSLSKHPGM